MSELKPCPFCGSTRAPEVSDVGECEECSKFDDCERRLENRTCEGCDRWERPMFVVCNYNISGCGASGPYRKTKAEAIAAWNTRAERTCRIEGRYGNQYCTCCGEMVGTWDSTSELYIDGNMVELWNYCPNCGARVVE